MTYTAPEKIGIYVAEEQELYRQIYKTSFELDATFRFIGVSSNGDEQALQKVLKSDKPDVLLMGTKRLHSHLFQELEHVCDGHPALGIVLLLTSINDVDSALLRKLVSKCRAGIGIYLKQSLDNPKQLHNMIVAVSHGQILFDPKVAGSIMQEKNICPFIKLLTERELEILNLLSLGYTNQGIAKSLCIDIKTVAHHLNNIYSKLKEDENLDLKHPRVSVARLYLETTGELVPLKASAPQFVC
jgi:DNA-binding NarL/FixJ family response regulator